MKKFVVNHDGEREALVFVPSSGDLFLIKKTAGGFRHGGGSGFRPLFWGFVFNWFVNDYATDIYDFTSFRPLFWGFVFNGTGCEKVSPRRRRDCFRPLFWGFVFNRDARKFRPGDAVIGFRPLFWGFVFNGVPGSAHPVLLGRAVCGGDGFLCLCGTLLRRHKTDFL